MARWAEDFNRMADSLQTTVTRLEEAQGQNRRFVADVTHELRTPLTALVAEASLLEGSLDGLPPDGRRAAQLLVADVRRLRTLVDDLLEISRFDAAAEQPSIQAIDLGRLVTAVVAARHPAAAVVLPPQPVVVDSDPRRLERILGNLLDNARAHAPGAGRRGLAHPGRRRRGRRRRGPGSGRRRPTRCPTCSTGSGRPTRRAGGRVPARPAWASRSPPSTRRCSVAACGPGTGRAAASSSPSPSR